MCCSREFNDSHEFVETNRKRRTPPHYSRKIVHAALPVHGRSKKIRTPISASSVSQESRAEEQWAKNQKQTYRAPISDGLSAFFHEIEAPAPVEIVRADSNFRDSGKKPSSSRPVHIHLYLMCVLRPASADRGHSHSRAVSSDARCPPKESDTVVRAWGERMTPK